MFGFGRQKPHHYREMLKIAWENRDELPFAWRILNDGVCDGCALGTSGLSDWTVEGTHLCMVRLELMRLNTAPALDPARWPTVAALGDATSAGAARAGPPARADAAPPRRARLPRRLVGRGARSDRRRAARRRSAARRLLPDVARHHQRGLLRGAEGGAVPRHQSRRQLRAPVSCRLDRRHESDARLRRVDLQLHGLAARRPDRVLRVERRQQPAGDDQVPAPREEERRADRGRQSVSRARPRALLGAVDRVERDVRHGARRPLVRRPHRRRSRVPRSACSARWSRPAAWTRRSSRDRDRRASRRHAIGRWRATGTRSSATAARPRDRMRGVRAAAGRSPECGHRLVDGPDAARARRRHDQGADERRPRARAARPAESRPRPDSRPLGRAGWRRGRLRAEDRRGDRGALGRRLGLPGPDDARLDDVGDDRPRGSWRRRSLLDRRRQLSRDAARRRSLPARAASGRGLRIHQDIVLSSSMLVDGDGDVLLLPATTRTSRTAAAPRHPPSGGSSSRRRFPGGASVRRGPNGGCSATRWRGRFPIAPAQIRFDDAAAIRDEIARAVPLYARHRDAARERRSDPVGRPHALRGRPVRDARTARRTSH